MFCQQPLQQGDALCGRDIGKSHQAAMGRVLGEDQLAKIGIDGHQDAMLLHGTAQKLPVPWIRAEITTLDGVVSLGAQPLGETPAGATIDEEFHSPVTFTASSTSWAITAWA